MVEKLVARRKIAQDNKQPCVISCDLLGWSKFDKALELWEDSPSNLSSHSLNSAGQRKTALSSLFKVLHENTSIKTGFFV